MIYYYRTLSFCAVKTRIKACFSMKKSEFSTLLPVLAGGLIFLTAAVVVFLKTADFTANGVKTDAVITEINGHYVGDDYEHDVFVKFTVDGREYRGELNVYEAGFKVGKTVPIIYKTDNPNDFIYGKRNTFIAVIMGAAGLMLVIIALKSPVCALAGKLRLAVYKRKGKAVSATVIRIDLPETKDLIREHTALLSFSGEDGNIYEKKFAYFDESQASVGSKVCLYVDYYDFLKFAVDFKGE